MQWYREHPRVVRLLAVVVPLVVSGVLHLASAVVANSAAALVLVLLVVGAAATGDRSAGVIAAVSAALGFDVFLTRPYFQLRIDDVEDVELAVLLLLVGVAVSELASWGVRQASDATEQAGFLRGALESADLASGSTDVADALERVSGSIRSLLGADDVRFEPGEHDPHAAVICRDGTLRHRGRTLDPSSGGLPSGPKGYTALPVVQRGSQVGYFRITTARPGVRPGRDQVRVAALLAGEWSLRAEPIRLSGRRTGPVAADAPRA